MTSINEIRSLFLDYFNRNGHQKVASSPLVPCNDPTLMFTNAGMVQFKNIFTGVESAPFKRAVSAQKCVRAGGKHNDLENVGYTARHLTFFEMMGNFSFGDYFKEEAIYYTWNLLTKELQFPKKRLLVTVYHTDDEAVFFWKKIAGLSDKQIIKISTSDNFWSMGDVGPCGPCSEIFYDHGEQFWGGIPGSPDENGDRFIEIWNLVFMQFEQMEDGSRRTLPRPCIDTGMGLERIAAVLQGVNNNYQTDLFKHLIQASEDLSGVKAQGAHLVSHRVIADHLRSSSFLIADGVLPSNEGRGYVLRRIMRRAMRHAYLLGIKEPFLCQLLPMLIQEMGSAYRELIQNETLISQTLLSEEKRFGKTLERGLALLGEVTSKLQSGDQLDGKIAFKLFDTYGFPLDLTQDILKTRKISIDTAAFDQAMKKQKQDARAHWVGSGARKTDPIWFKLQDQLGDTEFLAHHCCKSSAVIRALVKNQTLVETYSGLDEITLILNQSPFYPESGGQVGDTGQISNVNAVFSVKNTQKMAHGIIAHTGHFLKGSFSVGDTVDLDVDIEKRRAISSNHTATHLLHASLRKTLGTHVVQKGSLVTPDRLRFDFTHSKPLTTAELKHLEDTVNQWILGDFAVKTRLTNLEDAQSEGAMALFEDKYEELVRVVSIESPDGSTDQKNTIVSRELCGGTHVHFTGEISLFYIASESSVSSGVRRIEALTSSSARAWLLNQDQRIRQLSVLLKVNVNDIIERVESILEENSRIEKKNRSFQKKLLLLEGKNDDATLNFDRVGTFSYVEKIFKNIPIKDLKSLIDDLKTKLKLGVIAFINIDETERSTVIVATTEDALEKVNAVQLIQKASVILGGKGGGGRPSFAQGGGPNSKNAERALKEIREHLSQLG